MCKNLRKIQGFKRSKVISHQKLLYSPLETVPCLIILLLCQAFVAIDTDRSGKISYQEFLNLIQKCNIGLTNEQVVYRSESSRLSNWLLF
jgi:hypothetical protein